MTTYALVISRAIAGTATATTATSTTSLRIMGHLRTPAMQGPCQTPARRRQPLGRAVSPFVVTAAARCIVVAAEVQVRSIFTLVGLLIVMVVALVLATRQTRHDVEAVKSVTFALQGDAAPRPFDAAAASRLTGRLSELAGQPQLPADELREAAAKAAGWAAGQAPGTAAYHTAVNLRGAADELLAASDSLADPHRTTARRLLAAATAAPGAPGGGPPGAIGGLRDKLQEIQQSHQEQLQQTEHD